MASSLCTQWIFNFCIAKVTPQLLSHTTYGTFVLFGSCSVLAAMYAAVFVPETKSIPLESMSLLFEGNIIKGAIQDLIPQHSRSNRWRIAQSQDDDDDSCQESLCTPHTQHAKVVRYGTIGT